MKNSICILFLLVLGCMSRENKKTNHLPFVFDHSYVADRNILIYLFNPIDCENCKMVDRSFLKELKKSKRIPVQNMVFVIPGVRKIEIPSLLGPAFGQDWKKYEPNVFSSDSLKDVILNENHLTEFASYLLIYNPKGDSILYRSYTHDIDSLVYKFI